MGEHEANEELRKRQEKEIRTYFGMSLEEFDNTRMVDIEIRAGMRRDENDVPAYRDDTRLEVLPDFSRADMIAALDRIKKYDP